MTPLALCLLLLVPHGVCAREPLPIPIWATPNWQVYAAHIVAGEAPPGCETCYRYIACTIVGDVQGRREPGGNVRFYHPWGLHPGRWKGYKPYNYAHLQAIRDALAPMGCHDIPRCLKLGNITDYRYNWIGYGPAIVVGDRNGLIVCVEER